MNKKDFKTGFLTGAAVIGALGAVMLAVFLLL